MLATTAVDLLWTFPLRAGDPCGVDEGRSDSGNRVGEGVFARSMSTGAAGLFGIISGFAVTIAK